MAPCGTTMNRMPKLEGCLQDPEHSSILYNKGNEYLHYEDTWYVISAKPDEYAFIYYKGNNDAWRGYGGATVYTRASKLPEEYIPEMARAAQAVGLKWEDFTITDNSCKPPPMRVGFAKRIANEFENDLKSFGRGFTVIESELVSELTKEEQVLQKELKEAGKKLLELEQSYQPKRLFGFLSSLFPWSS